MGVDGIQYIHIRGPKECLDEIELNGVWVSNEGIFVPSIFKIDNMTKTRSEPRYLSYRLFFRNEPIYEQLELLLNKYPKCWIKNDYDTETGECGIWIGRFQNGLQQIQTREWQELTAEEIVFETDFSR